MKKLTKTMWAKLQLFCTLVLIGYLGQLMFTKGILSVSVDLTNIHPTLSRTVSQR